MAESAEGKTPKIKNPIVEKNLDIKKTNRDRRFKDPKHSTHRARAKEALRQYEQGIIDSEELEEALGDDAVE